MTTRGAAPVGRNDWWWHEAHALHDEAHHQAHRPLDLCVPLWSSPQITEERLAAALVYIGNKPARSAEQARSVLRFLASLREAA